MSAIRLEGVTKSFGKGPAVVSNLSLVVADGERLAVVGPSGAGKTTMLRLIAGFEKVDSGRIFFGERDVTVRPPEERDVGFVFQTHALYPHLTVEENLSFPLTLRGVARAAISDRVKAMAEQLHLRALLARRPGELSGGEAQRVALGRALIRRPAVLLMDEPLSSLPPDLRLQLRHELIKLHEKERLTILYVTHDHEEALAIGERVAVVNGGGIQQIGMPRDIYGRPVNRFVAGFIGKPSMNFLPARNSANGGKIIGVRPEHLELCGADSAWLSATISSIHYGGAHSDIVAESPDGVVVARIFGDPNAGVGERVHFCVREERVLYFDAEGKRIEP